MRPSHRLVRLLAVAGLGLGVAVLPRPLQAGRARATSLSASPHLEVIPNPGACQVVITPTNQATTLPQLNDPSKRVFCVNPGNYRAAKHIYLKTPGTATARRYLRYNAPFPAPPAIQQTSRAVFHGIVIGDSSYWVLEGLTIQPTTQDLSHLLGIFSSHHNVVEGNLIDASQQQNIYGAQKGVNISANSVGVPSTYNSIQNNVIRGGNLLRVPVDYTGVRVGAEQHAGAYNDYNKILDNEIYDWGDGVQVHALADTCNVDANPRGTLIDGNDIYITSAKRVRCSDGVPDPNGKCSCSENGVDVKSPASSRYDRWTRITNNRLWGFRPTLEAVQSCGGSGSNGQAITGNECSAHVFVAKNLVMDSTTGILEAGTDWRIVSNLLTEIRATDSWHPGVALFPISSAELRFNTVVAVDNAYEDAGTDVLTQCNAVIHDRSARGGGGGRGANHVTRYNYLYESVNSNFSGSTDRSFPNDTDSRNSTHCQLRKRWTGVQEICVPFGHTTNLSPHAALPTACTSDIGANFGLPGLRFP
jgi:hypothetical protein